MKVSELVVEKVSAKEIEGHRTCPGRDTWIPGSGHQLS